MTPDQLLDCLDPGQRAVAETAGLPVGVIAGAGTGKTRTVTHRLAYAALTGQLEPRATLAVTFTTAAATEVRQRLEALGVHGVQSRTFHAACLRQAQYFWPQAYNSALPQIVENRQGLIGQACRWIGVPDTPAIIRDISQEISWTKQTNVLPEEYVELARDSRRAVMRIGPDDVADAIVAYEQLKQAACVIDLDDLLLCTVALLSNRSDIARQVRNTYRHFVFDEFQDVSPVQDRLMELWVGDRDDVCVVGDPAQTIHSFAGARSTYLEGFVASHPGSIDLKLTRNYRSTPQIVQFAMDTGRPTVRLTPVRASGQAVERAPSSDRLEESVDTVMWLKKLHREGVAWDDMAVLFRTHAQAEAIRQILADEQVPFDYQANDHAPVQARVHVGTLHAAKGREWSVVALCGMDDTTMPYALARSPQQLAEERRLLYVGITRAEDRLRVSWPMTVDGRPTGPSRFLPPM
ncbi:MAG: ATP-dependent helicase [Propionibacteriaceae bacterium]|nr:ATP-dependent helicase [Propionibacteriaceae bacterium]